MLARPVKPPTRVLGGSVTFAVQLASLGLAFSSWTALALGHAGNVESLVVGAGAGATVPDACPLPLDDPGLGDGGRISPSRV